MSREPRCAADVYRPAPAGVETAALRAAFAHTALRLPNGVLDGAQDSDGGGLERYWGIRWGMTGEAAGGVFAGGGPGPRGVGWVRRLEVTMQ